MRSHRPAAATEQAQALFKPARWARAEAIEESQLCRIDGLEGPACNDRHDFQNRAYPAFVSCTIT